MTRGFNEVSVHIDLYEIDTRVMKAYIETTYLPEDMFNDDALARWAMEHGFIHKDDVQQPY